jgi:phosphotriesterase-related protein
MEKSAVGVAGPIAPDRLGFTLPHEHLTVDSRGMIVPGGMQPADAPMTQRVIAQTRKWPRSVADNLVFDRDDLVTDDLRRFRDLGGSTVVDVTPIGMGRDVTRYRRIGDAADVNVIASTGYYVSYGHQGRVAPRSQAELTAEMVGELTVGLGGGVRCGAIGEIGISPSPEPDELKVLAAALDAQAETGAPMWIHITGITPLGQLLDILELRARHPDQVIISHTDYSLRDLTLHRRALRLGLNIEFDLFGFPAWTAGNFVDAPTDTERVRVLAELAGEGFADQLFASQDVCMKFQLTEWGGYGYAHLLESVRGTFESVVGSGELLDQMGIANPRRVLCWDLA